MRPCIFARSLTSALLATTALSPLALRPAAAQSLPTGASVAYGNVGFQRSSGTLTINQSSQNAIVNYNSFSIGRGNTVTFNQPNASSAILNRVTGSAPSTIAGHLNANGQVYLVNPNGIAITKTGVVKVGGGFVASSLGMSDADFKAARRHFKGNGSSARVSNAGTITIGRGGYAALIGGEVRNAGSIAVPMGKVGLGSGEMATLDVSGDGFLQVALPTTRSGKGALVSNSGLISAEGGTVVLDAATARAAAREAINISGTIDAHSISGHNGSIVLGGGDGGRVSVSGHLSVANRHGTGGSITITGHAIALRHAHLDASGKTGGGTIRIGGDLHGGGTLQHAGTVTIDAKSVIRADATGKGNGGSVVVWSDETTSFAGLISAKGGTQGGDGGAAEVSSHGVLDYTGSTVLTAAKGAMGTLLLDPYDVVISGGADSAYTSTTANGTTADTPTGTSVINATTLDNQLASANVTITTGAAGSAGTDAGNITVAAPVTWSAATTLTLTALNAIAIDAPITITGAGGLTLNAATATVGTGTYTQPQISYGNNASISYAAGPAGTGISGQALTINGIGYTLLYTMAEVQAINSTYRTRPTALAQSVDATNFGNFTPVAELGNFYNSTFDGLGNTISNLTISNSGNYAGLFGAIQGGTIRNIGLVGASVTGTSSRDYVGGLVGLLQFGAVTGSYVTGTVSASNGGNTVYVGGLVGEMGSGSGNVVAGSYATATVTGVGATVGGLVGLGSGSITRSYATGAVSGSVAGGLVGSLPINESITQSYATGAVSGTVDAGGLVGFSNGTITGSYATGPVSGSGTATVYAGGLVGFASGNGSITQTYATGAVSGSANADVGGLVGSANGTILQSYASGLVSGGVNHGGLVGVITGGSIGANYWDTQTTNQQYATGNAGTPMSNFGLTTAAARGGLSDYSDFSSSVWYQEGDMRPILLAEAAPAVNGVIPVSNLHQLALVSAAPAASYQLAANIDASATSSTAASSSVFGAGGFAPIGESTPFTGTFNGAGHTISNLAINSGLSWVGLFGRVFAGGTVEDVGLIGGTVTGTAGFQPSVDVGALAGLVYGGTVTQSYATTAVNVAGGAGGGLVGSNQGTISQSYATGAVNGTFGGGNPSVVGGLVGNNVSGGSIAQSYSTGAVQGTYSPFVGGLVGGNSGAVASSYWDTTTSGVPTNGVGGGSLSGATPVSTQQLAAALPTGFDSKAWGNAGNQTTPYLLANPGPVYLGTDTSATPTAYTPILSVAALQAIGPTGNYVLGQNIDATIVIGYVPIGETTAFTGTFDGLGFAISNLTISSSAQYAGLFGQVGSGGTVEKVGLVGGSVTDTARFNNGESGAIVGSLVGSNAGKVVQAYATGAAIGGYEATVGGLVGNNTGTIAQSYAAGTVTVYGQTYGSPNSTGAAGGLVGQNYGAIMQSYATGAVGGAYSNGGLVGSNYGNGTITNGYYDTSTTGAGGIGIGVSTQQLAAATTLTALNGNGTVWGNAGNQTTPYLLANPGPVYLGTDSSATPTAYTPILSVAALQAIGPAGNYVLGQNLDATGLTGFVPIGETTAFAGTFNGLGFTISNLTITSTASYAGLFGQIDVGGTVENVGLVGGSVADTAAGAAVGGLVGGNSGTITQAYATGAATGGDSGYVGGLVGVNAGTIMQVYATGAATAGGNAAVGGLVGANLSVITQSYATGAATGGVTTANLGTAVGGLVGENAAGTIMQAYATGTVSGAGGDNSYVGGLVGANLVTIAQAYAMGAVSGGPGSTVGGLVGSSTGTITSGYYDAATTGQASGSQGDGSAGLTTAGLAAALPTGFDPTVWGNAGNQTTPYLLANPGPVYLGTDTSTTPTAYTPILSVSALQAIGPNGNYVLTQNLDATGVTGFTPIGESTAFTGTFDGLGFAIANLTINTDAQYAGLFGQVGVGGTVARIGMVGGSVTDSGFGASVGGLVGANSGTITQSYATGTVSVSFNSPVGGLVGLNGNFRGSGGGTITQSYATGTVNGGEDSYVGGLVGLNGNYGGSGGGTITQSYATGAVTSAYGSSLGGLVGLNGNNGGAGGGTITRSYWDTTTNGSSTPGVGSGSSTMGAVPGGSSDVTPLTTTQLAAALPAGFDTTVWGNAGNQTTPYLLGAPGPVYLGTDTSATPTAYMPILSVAALQAIGPSGNYVLGQNIDATGVTGIVPIGESSTGFTGTFDGLGFAISNLTISSGAQYAGLFGHIGRGGLVERVGLIGGSVTDTAVFNGDSGAEVGELAGFNEGTIAQSFAATGTATGGYSANVGGLVGENGGTIMQSYATSTAIVKVQGYSGFTGSSAGGLAGYNSGKIIESYATGAVSGADSKGGLVGIDVNDTIINSYYDTSTTGAGGIGIGVSTQQLAAATTLTALNSNGTVWGNAGNLTTPYLLANPGPVYLGTDTSSTPTPYTPVLSVAALQAIGPTGNYVLAQNLDATGVTGFVPIGESTPFTGTFDGLGFAISNLTISSGAAYAGLFGQVGTGGVVENVGMVGGSVSDTTVGAYVGGLVGKNFGTITQSFTTNAVTGGGPNVDVGGLVGVNDAGGKIIQTYATGPVSGGDSIEIGGLVGDNAGSSIEQSYATGAVRGGAKSYVGGLVGYVYSGTIAEIYATGGVGGGTGATVGGLVGGTKGVTVDKGFYDAATTGQAVGPQSDGSVGVSTQVLANADTLKALNSAGTVWGNAGNQTTPYLLANPGPVILATDPATGATTPTAYTPILSVAALQAIGPTGNYVLAQNLDATGVTGFMPIGESTAFTGTFNGLGFAIANLTINTDAQYAGLFGQVGTGGTVENVGLIGGSVTDMANGAFVGGLAGSNYGGTITRSYTTSAVTGGASSSVGGLVGTSGGAYTFTDDLVAVFQAATIAQSYATGAVSGGGSVGGLVGNNDGGSTIMQSYATGAVSGAGTSGGLAGLNSGGAITQSYATGGVSGGSIAAVGGLVGGNGGAYNGMGGYFYGTITQSYATGAVSGGAFVGGLAGELGARGTITQSYAMGAATGVGGAYVGGLVGYQEAGTITQSYATGAVSGGANLGGLVGESDAGTIGASAYDKSTTGRATGIGFDQTNQGGNIAALTTAQLQGTQALPSGTTLALGTAFAGGAASPSTGGTLSTQPGLYPYLTNFFPTGVQAVSGFAYTDAGSTPAASGANGAVTVSLDANGGQIAQATTGANGYYYAFLPAGTMAAGGSLLVSTSANTMTGTTNSATLTSATATAGNQSGVALYGNALTVPTGATLLSQAPSLSSAQAGAEMAAGTDAAAVAAVAGTTGQGLIATGASFTIDQAVTTGSTFVVQTATAGAPLTVAQPITIQSGGALSLLSSGALAIDANVTAQGVVPMTLAYDGNTATPAVTDLAFAPSVAITYTAPGSATAATSSQGGTLSVNGTPYTLLYTIADVANVDTTGLAGTYALAGTIDASGQSFTTGLIAGGDATGNVPTAFSGTLEGLGHTVGNLTIAGGSNDFVGLVGYSTGTLRDIGVVGGSISGFTNVGGLTGYSTGTVAQSYATGSVAGSSNIGGLVGDNGGTISRASASGVVTGTGAGYGNFQNVGGLVGLNQKNATISQSDATGAVSGSGTAANLVLGGLVGQSNGGINQSYATGSVAGTGRGTGTSTGQSVYVGGLVGKIGGGTQGSVSQSYATGAATASAITATANSYSVAGGLIGVDSATVTQTYATGAVTGIGAATNYSGGLIGYRLGGAVTSSAFDTQTTGKPLGIGGGTGVPQTGVTGLSTAALQSTGTTNPFLGSTSPTGFAGGASGVQNGVYPYLTAFFPHGVQAITGTAAAGTQVGIYAGGTLLGGGTVSTGANGYVYQAVAAGTLPASGAMIGALVTPQGGTAATGLVYTDAGTVTTNVLSLGAIATGVVSETTAETSLSALAADVGTTFGTVTLPTSANAATSITATNAGGFTLDQAVTAGGSYFVNATGGPLTLASTLAASGRAVILTSAGTITEASSGTLTAATATLTGTGFAFNNPTSGSFTTSATTNLRSLGGFTVGSATDAVTYTVTDASLNHLAVGALQLQSTADGSDPGDITVVDPTLALTAPITLNSARNIAFGGTASSFAGDLILASPNAGTVTQTGALTVSGTLSGIGTFGSVTLGNGGNSISTLGAFAVSTTGPGFRLSDSASGGLTLTGLLNTGQAGLTLDVSQGGITQSAGRIIAGTLTGSSAGSATFGQSANAIANLGDFAAGTLNLSDGVTLDVVGVVSATGTLSLTDGGGAIAQTGGTITAGTLTGSAAGAVAFGQIGNAIGTLGAFSATGSLALADSVGTLNLIGAISGSSISVSNAGGITLANTANVAASGTVVLAATGAFANDAGAEAVTSGSRWLVYSQSLGGDTFDGLNSNNTAIFGQTAASLPAGSVSQTGNRYIFANQPVLTVSPTNQSKVYGTAIDLDGDYTITGYQGVAGAFATDTAQTALVTGAPVIASAGSGAGAQVGPQYPITLTTGTLTAGNGYVLAAGGNATLTVTPASLTITAQNQTKVYGQTAALGTTGFTTEGLVTGTTDSVTAVTLSSNGAAAGANVDKLPYALNAGNAQGSGLTNYTITYVPGQLTVTPAPLTVTGTKTYDGTTGLATSQLAVAGAVNDESVTLTSGSGTTSAADAGTYLGAPLSNLTIQVAGGNALASNYALPTTGTLTIGKATIIVAGVTGIEKTYDGSTALPNGATGFTNTGIVGSNATVTAASARYASADAGSGPIDVTGLAISGTGAGNYVLSQTSVTGSGTITSAPITVIADSGGSIYGETPANPGLSATGLVAGQSVSVLTGLSSDFALTAASDAGTYALRVAGANGDGNYTVTRTVDGTFTVTPRPITIVAADEQRLPDYANPPLAYQIGGLGLVNGDFLTGGLSTSANPASPPGAYPIVQGSLAASPNYAVSYVPGALVVEPALPGPTALGSTAVRALQDALAASQILSSDRVDPTGVAAPLVQPADASGYALICVKKACTIVPVSAASKPSKPIKQAEAR